MEYEVTEDDILRFLDSICYKLDNSSASLCATRDDIWGKLKVLGFIVGQMKEKEDYEEEIYRLKYQLKQCQQEKQRIGAELQEYYKKVHELEEINDYYYKSRREIVYRETCDLRMNILEQSQTIRKLQKELERYTTRGAKQGNKNAYRSDIDPVQVFWDIYNGMKITEAAKKYNTNRDTIRKRCKEGERILSGQTDK